MDELLNRLQVMSQSNDIDYNSLCREYSSNAYKPLLHNILIERKAILRGKIDGLMTETETQSSEIEHVLMQLTNPTFPLTNNDHEENDEEWANLEKKYFDGIEKIAHELRNKEGALIQDQDKGLEQTHLVLRRQMNYRPIDEKDMYNAAESVRKRFDQAKIALRDESATKILVLRREIEQQGRKRRNFDKKTTDILQTWFNEHRDSPYPSDDEKIELAKLCGIKISQVNNWFGNQRIRNKQQNQKLKNDEFQQMAEHKPIVHHPLSYPMDYQQQQQQHSYLGQNPMHVPQLNHQQHQHFQDQQSYYSNFNNFTLSPMQTEMDAFNDPNMNFFHNQ